MTEYAVISYAYGEIKSEPVFDRLRDSYLLVNVGWHKGRRMHGCLVHIDIIDGKFGFTAMVWKKETPPIEITKAFRKTRLCRIFTPPNCGNIPNTPFYKMRFMFLAKIVFISFLFLMALSCQSQTVSNSSDKTNSNLPASNANQSNSQTNIPAPQTIKFESAEKAEIVGTFYESPKANSPAVLLLHQWQSNRKSYDALAKRLQAKGFGVLAIDGRGFGESVKTTDGASVAALRDAETVKAMKADVDNAFQFLAKQKNVDAARIGIVGASYGSSLAIIYAAENAKVKSVALLSPGLNYFGNMPTLPAVKSYGTRPLLLVAADDDKESADSVRKLKSSSVNDKYETQIYPKGGHGTGLFAAKVGLEDLLEQFLTKSL